MAELPPLLLLLPLPPAPAAAGAERAALPAAAARRWLRGCCCCCCRGRSGRIREARRGSRSGCGLRRSAPGAERLPSPLGTNNAASPQRCADGGEGRRERGREGGRGKGREGARHRPDPPLLLPPPPGGACAPLPARPSMAEAAPGRASGDRAGRLRPGRERGHGNASARGDLNPGERGVCVCGAGRGRAASLQYRGSELRGTAIYYFCGQSPSSSLATSLGSSLFRRLRVVLLLLSNWDRPLRFERAKTGLFLAPRAKDSLCGVLFLDSHVRDLEDFTVCFRGTAAPTCFKNF